MLFKGALELKTLQPVRPSMAIENTYKRRLLSLIDEMANSVLYWISATYRKNPPLVTKLAADATPNKALRAAIRKLKKRWLKRFDSLAKQLASYFAKSVTKRSDVALKNILRKGGVSVKFELSVAQKDVVEAIVAENVALIKSIPQQYLSQVEGIVLRAVQTGRDLHEIAGALRHQFGVSKRRAALIARDQNNKATASLQRVRQLELGITEAIWVHSGGGKTPRPTHVRAGRDKVRYKVAEGWYDPHEKKFILPGELVNCRCVARPVIPGFSIYL